MGKYIVTINEDYDDWKIKGLLAEVIAWDRDKRFLVKLLENSKTEYLNIGDTIWLKPHWLDGIYDNLNRFTAIYKLPYDENDKRSKKERWKEYKQRVKRFKTRFYLIIGDKRYDDLNRKQVIGHMMYLKDTTDDFRVGVYFDTKTSFCSGSVVECDTDGYWTPNNFKEVSKRVSNLQNKISKILRGETK